MRFKRSFGKRLGAAALAAVFLAAFAPAGAGADEMSGGGFAVPSDEPMEMGASDYCGGSLRTHVGLGVASVLSTIVYGPVKSTLALLGTLASGVGYAVTLGNADTARKVAGPALDGDYVIVCDHLTGDRRIEFFGTDSY